MYRVLCDNALMCDSRIEELVLINPVLNLEENKAGSFSFKIPPNHPYYDTIKKRKTIVEVYQDDEEEPIFSGMCIEATTDFYKQKDIYCEGDLTFLNDSTQRPFHYKGYSVRGLLEKYIANHNAQVEAKKHFQVGIVTVTDPNDYITCYTNMENTLQCIKEDLVDDLGGIIRTRRTNGIRYIDYLAESPNTNSQVIKLGKNLVDFKSNIDSSEIATAVIPLGAKLEKSTVEGLETRLTIESVNNGLDYVHSADAVEAYGWIYKTVTFDDVTTASALKSKGEKYLAETQFENMVIEAKAIDLHFTDSEIERFKLSDQIRVKSAPYGLNKYFRLTKQTLKLNNPDKDTITLGKNEAVSLSAKSTQTNNEVKKAVAGITPSKNMIETAMANTTQMIKDAMGGYVVKTNEELLIMDTDNIETATRVWRWNINGLGYSSTGYNGKYALAMTMDGGIVADFITSGKMMADRIYGGTLSLGGADDKNGLAKVYDSNGNLVGWLNSEGFVVRNAEATDTTWIRDGKIYFYQADVMKAGIGANDLVTAGQTLAAATFRSYGDVIVFSQDGMPFYVINPFGKALTDNEYTENHYFRGNARFTDYITALKLEFSNKGVRLYDGAYGSGDAVISTGGFYANGDMGCSGQKYRVVETENYGKVGMNAFETAEAYFADIGSGVIADNGEALIDFEEVFSETIEIDAGYQVFITQTSKEKAEYIEKRKGCFVVHGEAGATFDWMLCCKQKCYAEDRLKAVSVTDAELKGEQHVND